MIGKAIRAILAANSNITNLIGDRIYPLPMPQANTLPSIAYEIIDKPGIPCDNGTIILQEEVAVECFSESLLQSETINELIRKTLHGYSGTVAGLNVVAIMYSGGESDHDDEMRVYYTKAIFKATTVSYSL